VSSLGSATYEYLNAYAKNGVFSTSLTCAGSAVLTQAGVSYNASTETLTLF
jgi:hypothetical protein